jgi:hypothetical protein
MISSTEALLILNKWKVEKSPLRLVLASSFGGGSFFANLVEIDHENLQFIGADSLSEFLVRLTDVGFEYGEPREAPSLIRAKSEAKYVSVLTAIFSSGDRLSVFEIRSNEPS